MIYIIMFLVILAGYMYYKIAKLNNRIYTIIYNVCIGNFTVTKVDGQYMFEIEKGKE